jgi:predicted HAD superfamily Cof-like phosphohydrolase
MFDAQEFRTRFNQTKGLTLRCLTLQQTLIAEEAKEVAEAADDLKENMTSRRAKEHLLKEMADLVYVCYQMAAAFDWDLTEAATRVHNSNLSKLGPDGKPIYREDGKILKGPSYYDPILADLVGMN